MQVAPSEGTSGEMWGKRGWPPGRQHSRAGPHLLTLQLLSLAQQLDEQAGPLQVVPQPLPVLQLLFGCFHLLVVFSL